MFSLLYEWASIRDIVELVLQALYPERDVIAADDMRLEQRLGVCYATLCPAGMRVEVELW